MLMMYVPFAIGTNYSPNNLDLVNVFTDLGILQNNFKL